MSETLFDLIVIGGGPAGYVCSIRASQNNLKVACIEKEKTLGGVCLNVGCIPSKFLLNMSYKYQDARNNFFSKSIKVNSVDIDIPTLMNEKEDLIKSLCNGVEYLFKKNKITRFEGIAKFEDYPNNQNQDKIITIDCNGTKIKGKNIVIATGSIPRELPNIKINEKDILSSTGMLSLTEIPKNLVVIGGGVIGLEMATIWNRLGSKVYILENMDTILPMFDKEISLGLKKILENDKIEILCNHKVSEYKKNASYHEISVLDNNGVIKIIEAEKILISIGRTPFTKDLNIDVEKDKNGFIKVDSSYRTSVKNVFAIGDVVGGIMLAHKASEEGILVADMLANKPTHMGLIPSVVYTDPELACVGKTEADLQKEQVEYTIGTFMFSANSRAKVNRKTKGFVKVIVSKFDKKILGVHIIGEHAGLLIAEACLAMEYSASAEDVASICHSHPDLSEALREAAMQAYFHAIHS